MMTTIVESCKEFGLAVSENKAETMSMSVRGEQPKEEARDQAARKMYAQTHEFVGLESSIAENPNVIIEVSWRCRLSWWRIKRYRTGFYDPPSAPFELKIRMQIQIKVEVIDTLQHWSVTCTTLKLHYKSPSAGCCA